MLWGLLGSRYREKEAEMLEALQRAQDEKRSCDLDVQERQRERDEKQKACDDWNTARKAEIIGYQPRLSIRTNIDRQRFISIEDKFELPGWLIVGARISEHGAPKYVAYLWRSDSGIISGGYATILIEMASGRQWEWLVAWCHAEVALDALKKAIAECRGIA